MKKRVEEMEAEAAKLRELQAAAEEPQDGTGSNAEAMETDDDRHAADERSIYVGNVRKFHVFYSSVHVFNVFSILRWTTVLLLKRYKHISKPVELSIV